MLILAIIIGKYLIRSANHEIRGVSGFRWFSDDAELAEYEIHAHGRIRANDIIFASASMYPFCFVCAFLTSSWEYVRI